MQQQHSVQEIGRRGQEIYDTHLRSRVEADNHGKFLVLDVKTGEYEIDAEDLTASNRLLQRLPDALLYGVRIGYPTAYRFGGNKRIKPQ